jgi:Glycosyl transferase family 2
LFEPWQNQSGVRHVVLDDDGRPGLPDSADGMTVFWWRGRPVAHRWWADGAPLPSPVDPQWLARIDAEEQSATPPRHDASVVICTRDRPDELRRCLASLPQQTLRAREVIVVDNASRR